MFKSRESIQGSSEPSRKSQIRSEFGSLRRDWFESRGIKLDGKGYSELKELVKEFYEANGDAIKEVLEAEGKSLEGELESISRHDLSSERVSELRKKLDLPKWVSLAETVAFIKTVLDLDDKDLQAKYVEYATNGISLDDMRNVLVYENDVKPARLDTDIYHQSPERSRSVVEIISNAVDAVNNTKFTIGRFGVGFYQILSHLKSEKDYISVTTGNEESGFYEIKFRLKNNQIEFHLEEAGGAVIKGTTVELFSDDFPKEESEQLIRKHFSFNGIANIICNGEQVNNLSSLGVEQDNKPTVEAIITDHGYIVRDDGIGMSPQVILEKLLVPKLSGKKPFQELKNLKEIKPAHLVERFSEENKTMGGRVVINVGGVLIEDIELSGVNTVKTMVIDLPPFTMLGEERNQIAVDETTITSIKTLIDEVVSSGDVQIINSLAQLVARLQQRSMHREKANNLVEYLKSKANEVLPSHKIYMPNAVGFDRLEIPDLALIDASIKLTNWNSIPHMLKPELKGDGSYVYVGPLKSDGAPAIQWRNRIIFSRELFDKHREDPTLINLYLAAYENGSGTKAKRLSAQQTTETENSKKHVEHKEYKDFLSFITLNWDLLGFSNEDSAVACFDRFNREQIKASEIVHEYIIGKFPEEYARYFVDAVFSNRLDRLNEDNLKNFSSLSKAPGLPDLMTLLDIHPIVSRDSKINHFRGIVAETSFDTYSDQRFENDGKPSYNTRDAKDEPWHSVKYWDEYNLVHESGEVFSQGYVFEEKLKAHILRDGGKLALLDNKTKIKRVSGYEMPPGFKLCGGFEFNGDIFILLGDEYDMHANYRSDGKDGKSIWSNYHNHKNYKIVDFSRGVEFNPRPDLGKIVGITDSGRHKVAWIAQLNIEVPYIIYEKEEANKKNNTYHAFFFDGRVEKVYLKDNCVPPVILKELPPKSLFQKKGEGRKVSVVLGRKTIVEHEFAEISDRYYANVIERIARNSMSVEDIRIKGQAFALISYGQPTGNKVTCPINKREANYFHNDKWESAYTGDEYTLKTQLYDSSGGLVFELLPNEGVIEHKEVNGEHVFLVFECGAILSDRIREGFTWNTVGGYRVINMKGQKLPDEYLKEFSINFEYNNIELASHHNKISLFTGDKWRLKFGTTKFNVRKGDGSAYIEGFRKDVLRGELRQAFCINIVSKENDQNLIEGSFKSIFYNEILGLWECTSLDWLEKDGVQYNRIIYLDTAGNIVKERLVTERKSILLENSTIHPAPLGLLPANNELSQAKAESIQAALEASVIENDQIYRRFINRVFKYANLSDEAFADIVEVLLEVDDIEQHVLVQDLIIEAGVRLDKYDQDTKKYFYRLWMKMANKEWTKEQAFEFLGKLVKVFEDKIANLSQTEKDKLYKKFDMARDYGRQYIANGWNIVKHKTPIPGHLIPEKIRPIVEFLRASENEIMSFSHNLIEFNDPQEVALSKLIQTKRLEESKLLHFQGSLAELRQLVDSKTSNKHQDHIKREIIHPIYYQSVNNPYLFIRELVQNAHDAVKKMEDVDRTVSVDIFSRNPQEVTLKISDPVGMSLQEVLNYFLIPGETTKLGDKESIGYFGQGLFTLFRGSKEVVLKTGKGDGVVTKLKIEPIKDDQGMTSDLKIKISQEEGSFKGTIIERTVATAHPTVEAAYIKNATATFTGLVNADVIDIKLNGTNINEQQRKLSAVDVSGFGEMCIYDAPNNVVTQRGLFIKELDSDFQTGIFDIEKVLDRRGYVISIPDNISLTRSRNEIARKQEVLGKLREYLPLLKMRAYMEIFRQDIIKGHIIQLENLPYDYFYNINYPTSGKIFDDAQNLRKGRPIDDVSNYLNKGDLIQLLVLLPVVELDNEAWSLAELKEASLGRKAPLESDEKYEQLPRTIRDRLLEGRKTHDRLESNIAADRKNIVRDFELEDLADQPEFIITQVSKRKQAYTKLVELANKLNNFFSAQSAPRTTLYNEPDSKAHASSRFNMIGWNLDYWKNWRIEVFDEYENPTDSQLAEFLEVWSHEMAHIVEQSSFTHNQSFYLKQADVLAKLMRAR